MTGKRDDRITETAVGFAVLKILGKCPEGAVSVEKLKRELPKYLTLSEADQTPSDIRATEEIWEEQVRNLKSHDKTAGNVFAEGFVEAISKGIWKITDAGTLQLDHRNGKLEPL
jgi:hypothetical protein